MQTKTKQRTMGAVVMITLVAIVLAYLFSHPLPGLTHSAQVASTTNEDGQLVYDLNLQAAKETEATAEEDELVPSHPLTEEEMRQRAAATNTVTEKLLRTSGSPLVIAEKQKETLNDALAQEDETLAELNHEEKPTATADNTQTTKAAAQPVTSAQVATPAATVATANDSTRDSALKQVSSESVPLAWVVQLGSFTDKQNAMRLVEVLRSMKLDVYTRTAGAADNSSIKVYVGPYIERRDVEKAQQDLERELNIKGVVKKYSLS